MSNLIRAFVRRAFGLVYDEEQDHHTADHLPPFHEVRPLFERELRRARRYERPLSLLVLGFDRMLDSDERARRSAQLGSLLQDALRETDLIGYSAETAQLAALLPEADASTAARGSARIRQLWAAGDRSHLISGAATYPRDGLTLDDLVASARRSSVVVTVATNGRRRRIESFSDA